MSTYYRPRTSLKLDDVRKLKEFDVVKDGKDWGFQSKDCFLSVETNSKGYVIDVYRHGQNDVDDIFPKIRIPSSISINPKYVESFFETSTILPKFLDFFHSTLLLHM